MVNDKTVNQTLLYRPSGKLFGLALNRDENLSVQDAKTCFIPSRGSRESALLQHVGGPKAIVYVQNKDGKALMPCRPSKARKLLKSGKAKVVRRLPFIIRLQWNCESNVQEVVGGMDSGSKVIGSAAVSEGKVLYKAEIILRNDISKKMERRKMYRRTRRSRKTRYRKARWQNRSSLRKKGRLAPSIKSKVESHLREKRFIESILPISKWIVETASFDIHKISNPEVVDYQSGKKKGFYNTKAYVLHRDGYKCTKCKCKNTKLEVHHIVFRSNGGTDEPSNLITLCKNCHEDLHDGKFEIKGKKSKTKHSTEMGIVKSQLKKMWDFQETFGYETKYFRERMGLKKSHSNDAVAICGQEIVKDLSCLFVKRHVASGDYQQTKGKRSEIKIPTGKLFNMKKYDYIKTDKCEGFIKGKRSSGFFAISDIYGNIINPSVNIKKDFKRIRSRKTTLTNSSYE